MRPRPILGPDRSNARRSVQSLIRWGDLEWTVGPEGERRLKLTWLLAVAAHWRLAGDEETDEGLNTPCTRGHLM